MDVASDQLFPEAMSHLASGVAVVTARRPDGRPWGSQPTSSPPTRSPPVGARIDLARLTLSRGSRGLRALRIHLLRADQLGVAHGFANRESQDKFAGLAWAWDEDVPELAQTLVYLRCRRVENFTRYDHTVLIGDLESGRLEPGEPLVYARRRMDWLLNAN